MAFTGILTRGEAVFNDLYIDPPIAREVAVAAEHLGVGSLSSTVYWLNLQALSAVGKIIDDQGNVFTGFKTSELPITYDGNGYVKNTASAMLVDGAYQFRYAPLDALEVLSDTSFKFGTMDIDVAVLDFISTTHSTIDTLSQTSITVTFTKGEFVIVYNESLGTQLGTISTSGGSLSYASIAIGTVVSVYAVDDKYNHSAKTVGVVP